MNKRGRKCGHLWPMDTSSFFWVFFSVLSLMISCLNYYCLVTETKETTEAVLDVIPPCNKNAENVEDVYSLSDRK